MRALILIIMAFHFSASSELNLFSWVFISLLYLRNVWNFYIPITVITTVTTFFQTEVITFWICAIYPLQWWILKFYQVCVRVCVCVCERERESERERERESMSACVCVALKKSMKRNGLLFQDRMINYHSQCFGASYLVGALQKLRLLTFFNHTSTFSLTALSSERAHPKSTENRHATARSNKFCQTDLST